MSSKLSFISFATSDSEAVQESPQIKQKLRAHRTCGDTPRRRFTERLGRYGDLGREAQQVATVNSPFELTVGPESWQGPTVRKTLTVATRFPSGRVGARL
jgi:hypothetical protein